MPYRSTRQEDADQRPLTFEEAVLEGLAPDGGLYIPTTIPHLTLDQIWDLDGLPFHELAFRVFRPFIETDDRTGIPDDHLRDILKRSFATFSHPDVTPVLPLPTPAGQPDLLVLELHHGPTFAFKDVALQVLGNLFEYFLKRKNAAAGASPRARINVLGATSGDTGGAAIYGLRGKRDVSVFILHPKGRISPVQEQQMTSVLDSNVHNVALDGATFDDCQDAVKALFSEPGFKKRYSLAAVNSINWARILAQTSYYFSSWLAVQRREGRSRGGSGAPPVSVRYSVPTGNFGDVLAGYYASRMGLPVQAFVVATNENDILHRFWETGAYSKPSSGNAGAGPGTGAVKMTLSPAMDILVSSNFERLLWHLARGESSSTSAGPAPRTAVEATASVRGWMRALAEKGVFDVGKETLALGKALFSSRRVSDEKTRDAIRRYKAAGYVLDPHTAVGVVAAEAEVAARGDGGVVRTVVLATASPGKFPEAVLGAVNEGKKEGGEGWLKYEDFAPKPLIEQSGKPRRIVEVQTGGDKKRAVEGVRAVIVGTVGDQV
ncbi:threonine synthase [Irineochytrium annulatum]|nr:threonine synthase [Irineochytrium annulatum]